jgi:hypothetical protein
LIDFNVVRPYDINIGLTWWQIPYLLTLVETYKVETFIEIGVLNGGIGTFLATRCAFVPNFKWIGVELVPDLVDDRFIRYMKSMSNENELIIGDAFTGEIQERINNYIKDTKGRACIFCDNGNKPREIKEYSKFIRTGDIICVHDYPGEIGNNDLEFLKYNHLEIIYGGTNKTAREEFGIPSYMRIN